MDRIHYAILVVVCLALIGTFWIATDDLGRDDESYTDPGAYNYVTYAGNVSSNSSFTINGTLHMSAHSENYSRFENVSVRLYDADGNLLRGRCLGELSERRSRNVSLTHHEVPEYVVFASPWFWTKATVDDFQVYYFQNDDGTYRARRWVVPSDLPVEVRRHHPCR